MNRFDAYAQGTAAQSTLVGLCEGSQPSTEAQEKAIRTDERTKVWAKVSDLIGEFGDDPAQCLAILAEYAESSQ